MTDSHLDRYEANERVTNVLFPFSHLAQGAKQHPSLDTFMLKRIVISPSVTQQATVLNLNRKLPTSETMAASSSCSSRWCNASKSAWTNNIDFATA